MSVIRLSICIATYNRAGYIGQTIDSILPQLDDEVELLVVDGASTDGTEEVMRSYSDPRIRYVRLPAKGGVDQDYCKAVELARGEFCWLFTDDDLFKPGAVAAVKKALEAGYGMVIVNAEVRDRTLENRIQRRRVAIAGDRTYAPGDGERLFADALLHMSFIGSVVIRRSIWLSRDQASYFGTEFVHVGVIFQKPLAEPVFLLAEPWVTIRYGNAHWTPRSLEIWLFKWPKLVWSFGHISQKTRSKVCRREPWRNPMHLVLQRSLGSYTVQSYRTYFSSVRAGFLWRSCAWLIAVFPRKMSIGLHWLYCLISGAENRAYFEADHATNGP